MQAGNILQFTDSFMLEAYGQYGVIVHYNDSKKLANRYAVILEDGRYIALLHDSPGTVVAYNPNYAQSSSGFNYLVNLIILYGKEAFFKGSYDRSNQGDFFVQSSGS